jgi:hypothetical protein
VSVGLPSRRPRASASAEEACTLHVRIAFHDLDPAQTDALAEQLIGRAHQLANLPQSECDVDVSVEVTPPRGAGARPGPAR